MRKVIDSINQGQLDRDFGTLTLSVSSIEHTIREGESCEGSFSVLTSNHDLLEGTVISDDYRMECINSSFSGIKDDIAYIFHGENLLPGQDIRGNFNIISNRGEYVLPFVIHIESCELMSSLGPVRNLFHFTNLAKSSWEEALELFYTPGFESIFRESDREYLPLYRCLSGIKGSKVNMDEFLISIRKKTPVEYIASETSIEINDPVGVSRYSFNISRNGWGYTHIRLETEGDFLSLDRKDVYNDDFLGNNYQVYYYIDSDKLHSGKNYGSITIKDKRGKVVIPVLAHRGGEDLLGFKGLGMLRMRSIIQIM